MEDHLKRALTQQPREKYQVEVAFELPDTTKSVQFQTGMYQNQQTEVNNSLHEAAAPAKISLQSVDFGQPLQQST
jgi:hypothetical protein